MTPIYVDGVEYSPESILRLTNAERAALSPAVGKVVYDTDDLLTYSWDGSAWNQLEGGGGGLTEIIDINANTADSRAAYKAQVDQYLIQNANVTPYAPHIAFAVPSGTIYPAAGHQGGCYMPESNLVMFGSYNASVGAGTTYDYSHFVDSQSGQVVRYNDGISIQMGSGAIYHPPTNRVYHAPSQSSTVVHYMEDQNLVDDSVVAPQVGTTPYSGVGGSASYYFGGALHHALNRIYFAPYKASLGSWHYVNSGGTISSYTASSIIDRQYAGAVYHPLTEELFFIPHRIGTAGQPTGQTVSIFHKIDSSGNLQTYVAPSITLSGDSSYGGGPDFGPYAFAGGVWCPYSERIYMVPHDTGADDWWYIDSGGSWQSFTPSHTAATDGAYWGGAYSPTLNRVYFGPYQQANTSTTWHGINSSGTPDSFEYSASKTTAAKGYAGAIYDPITDRVWFVPSDSWASGTEKELHFVRQTENPIPLAMGRNHSIYNNGGY